MAKLGPLSLSILFIWAFSPLGGQASLRILRTEYNNITDTTQFAYLNMTRQLSTFSAGYSTSDSQYSVDALYTGCLIGTPATKSGSQDSWGNLKIPMLETLNESSRPREWIDVPEINVTYSSLLRVPIAGLPADRNSSFNISTYYYNVQCPEIRSINNTGDWLSPLKIPFTSTYNTSIIFESQNRGRNSFFLSSYTNESNARSNGSDTSPVHMIFLSHASDNMTSQDVQRNATKISVADCFMTATFVESDVQCYGKDCRVDKIRISTSPPASSFIPPLMMGYSEPFGLLTAGLESATAVTNLYSTPTEHYLYGETSVPFAHGLEVVNLYNINNVGFSTRLTQIINTYWLASLAPEASTNNLPSDPRDLLAGNSTVLGKSVFPFAANATNATTFYLEEVYQCNRGWLAALIISNVLLFAAGVAGTTMKYMSLGPDVLGYVSSFVAHNPYTTDAGARGNSAMDGLERSRSMHGIRIRLEDVRERDQVGHIAVSTLTDRGESSRKLKSGRLYS